MHDVVVTDAAEAEQEGRPPTEEELATLPLIAAAIPWGASSLAASAVSTAANFSF